MDKDAALDEIASKIQRDAPDYFRAIMLAPQNIRGDYLTLIGLDMELYQALQAQEPLIGAMKIAWWSEKLTEKQIGAHPILVAIDATPELYEYARSIINARRDERDSFPELITALARLAEQDEAFYLNLIERIGAGDLPKGNIPKSRRAIAAMILPKMTRFQFTRFALFGR